MPERICLCRMTSLFSGLLLCVIAANGQVTTTSSTLAADSNDWYRSFFQFHDQFSTWADQKKASEPAAVQRLDTGAATLFGIDQADLSKLRAISQQVVSDLKAIDKEQTTYPNALAKQEARSNPAVIKDFENRRQASVSSNTDKLKQVLSPASWNGLHTFINDEHRQNIKVVAVHP
jgi:hypothetical protein